MSSVLFNSPPPKHWDAQEYCILIDISCLACGLEQDKDRFLFASLFRKDESLRATEHVLGKQGDDCVTATVLTQTLEQGRLRHDPVPCAVLLLSSSWILSNAWHKKGVVHAPLGGKFEKPQALMETFSSCGVEMDVSGGDVNVAGVTHMEAGILKSVSFYHVQSVAFSGMDVLKTSTLSSPQVEARHGFTRGTGSSIVNHVQFHPHYDPCR